MKTVVIIPGFSEHVLNGTCDWRYKQLISDAEHAGYKVVIVQPTWNRHVIQEWIADAEDDLKGKVDSDQTLLVGFSFGAMIAAGLAARRPFRKVVLCSLSPYFAEDIPKAKRWWLKTVGVRRVEAFKEYSFKDIAANWKAKETSVLLGEIEMARRKVPLMERRGREASTLLPNALFVPVPNAGHNIAHPNYAALLKAELTH